MDLGQFAVSTVMNAKVVTADEKTTVREATKLVLEHAISGLPVVSPEKRLVGVVSEKELLVLVAGGELDSPVKFNASPDFARTDASLKDVLVRMIKQGRKWLPIVDREQRVVGVVSRRDLLRVLADRA